ncbi:carbohydrate porin [Acidocella sp.]|uniref:carbohydrate porin n=1 Tax=Acidocella sp. TaxID=50710 RepID=UPI002F3E7551
MQFAGLSNASKFPRLTLLSGVLSAGFAALPIAAHAQEADPTPQPAPTPITAGQTASAPVTQQWAVHGQLTSIWMAQPAFHAPYTGSQSLSPAANGRETVQATVFLGFRPWQGGEIWFNPTMDQGYGLDDTTGLAGYINAESAKVGETYPYYQMPRAFFRQTIDLGGQTEAVAPDLNQLGGTETANRLVFTVGKFAVTDIFDTNAYANNPASDFLNWSVVNMGAFDYAANAWGYTYGAAAQWYQGPWVFSAGAFDLSQIPNGNKLDNRIGQQMQYVGQITRNYALWSQPGAVSVLYFLSRGMLGSYGDALALAAQTNTVPNTANVREERSKGGFGINIQQQIIPGLGVFARASANNGGVEADEYTDISQSVSAGISVQGGFWGRPDDTFGLAGAVNTISHTAKEYFAAGGLGILIGDGQLEQAGPEQILETYYSIPMFHYAALSADYQFINNPAYNVERGPVSVFQLRLNIQI